MVFTYLSLTLTGKNWSILKQTIPYSYEFRCAVNEYPLTKYMMIFSGGGVMIHGGLVLIVGVRNYLTTSESRISFTVASAE